jgi:hypothetical protein
VTDKEWQDRYRITSAKGKIWTRSEIRNRAVTMASSLLMHKPPRELVRTEVSRALDDESFMRPRGGMVPARVIEDAAFVAFHKLAPETKP